MNIRIGNRELSLDRPRVMGVLNVTPDSFSDGGHFVCADDAVQHAIKMREQGADIIDVGGESTRPGSPGISIQEELDRIIPVIEKICSDVDVAISVDTSKPDVMRAAVEAGAALINDVFALRQEGAVDAAHDLDVAVCLMHMQGEPRSMQDQPTYDVLPGEVIEFLRERIDTCLKAGISRERLLIDPGFGFGKTDLHNLEILAKLDQFSDLGIPMLVGLSRKRTLGILTGKAADQRVFAGVAAAVIAVRGGANIVRTHDVAATVDALKIADAVNASGQRPD